MIVFPFKWQKDYSQFIEPANYEVDIILEELKSLLRFIKVPHLAYSGGIDSTIMLNLMSFVMGVKINTYTIASRIDHPDILFARIGSKKYNTVHHEIIVSPNSKESDEFLGDNVVRQFFEEVKKYTDQIICCDGIDEFMCGYYDHIINSEVAYTYYLSKLCSDHLFPLDKNSGGVKVYLPYLYDSLINIYRLIPLNKKVSKFNRKLIMRSMATKIGVSSEIIERNKYGFCDAFRETDKKNYE